MDHREASRKAALLKEMVESEGWAVLQEQVRDRLRHEQTTLMKGGAKEGVQYERLIGQWAGMSRRVQALVAGFLAYGEQANKEIESGKAAEAA